MRISPSQFVRTVLLLCGLAASGAASHAAVIGTFSSARPGVYPGNLFTLFPGSTYFGSASDALSSDGHSFVNLNSGISAASLTGIDTVYLPVSGSGGNLLSTAEVLALEVFATAGGVVVVQADNPQYNNLLTQFGIVHNHFASTCTTPCAAGGTYAPLTNGPRGAAASIRVGVASNFTLPSGGISLFDGIVGVLPIGGGFIVALGEVNSFDGPGNENGFSQYNGAALWRNVFEMQGTAIPEPGSALLFTAGLAAILARRAMQK